MVLLSYPILCMCVCYNTRNEFSLYKSYLKLTAPKKQPSITTHSSLFDISFVCDNDNLALLSGGQSETVVGVS